jgi:acetate kinase
MSAARRVAVLNAGSATLKIALFRSGADGIVADERKEYEWDETDANGPLEEALARLDPPAAFGHRVVHGGARYHRPTRIDAGVEDEIERLIPLAPLHNARALAGIRAARQAFDDVPSFALFDTAFHAERSAESMCYALPDTLVRELQLKRYGFHGIAHAALGRALADAQGLAPSAVTAVTLQLGAGCSACAIAGGRSVETSMGYTPLEGLVMASRCGDVDPSIPLHLIRAGYTPDDIERRMNRESGLLALAGHADLREILKAEAAGDERAAFALRVFVRRIVLTVGAYLTLLDGAGALVFGGGIGTHSVPIRERIAAALGAWNVALDPRLNTPEAVGRISRTESRPVFVFQTDEEKYIAGEVAALMQ